ncbi:hypothetical protein L2E82_27257 [Cichorium intybus]|uniref:Uncharacterized protein n=1 Tax=Cichorium intybus TaxID=13427 RepID=A0ACB9CSM2_CICIN|nr:hypothetical protein L2E82_27257 [Cichorium intybus]
MSLLGLNSYVIMDTICPVILAAFSGNGAQTGDYKVPEDVKAAGFNICADEAGSLVEGHDLKKLKFHGGVEGLAEKLKTSTTNGLAVDNEEIARRQEVFDVNKFAESPQRSFWVFVWEALHDMTLMIVAICVFVSLIVGIATEGRPKGAHDGYTFFLY